MKKQNLNEEISRIKNMMKIVKEQEESPQIVFNNGGKVSIQCGSGFYCTPRNDQGPYTEVEVGFPSRDTVIPESLLKYIEQSGSDNPHENVYPYVPAKIIKELIDANGGITPETQNNLPELDFSGQEKSKFSTIDEITGTAFAFFSFNLKVYGPNGEERLVNVRINRYENDVPGEMSDPDAEGIDITPIEWSGFTWDDHDHILNHVKSLKNDGYFENIPSKLTYYITTGKIK